MPTDIDLDLLPDNPYFLLTPGPLSTTKSVKAAMLRDWCTWDDDYNSLVRQLREDLVALAVAPEHRGDYTSVLMQGSGTFSVESVVGTMVPRRGKLLVLTNGAYGERIATIARYLEMDHAVLDFGETSPSEPETLDRKLAEDPAVTHVAVVHCETTTGMLNPIREVGEVVKQHGKVFFVDAMSSFGGVPMDLAALDIDFMVSSANKCVQGVPGFGFCVARRSALEGLEGRARSLSLDLYAQWKTMEDKGGKWRFTSPTHVVRAFIQAMAELHAEGGVAARHARYAENQRRLVAGMREMGFATLLPDAVQSPIITSFLYPEAENFTFERLYEELKERGFVIYPGKISAAPTFRIGAIGHVFPEDVDALLAAVKASVHWG